MRAACQYRTIDRVTSTTAHRDGKPHLDSGHQGRRELAVLAFLRNA
jgi:hypothetical protein